MSQDTSESMKTLLHIAKIGDPVIYVPHHANGDISHQDCERGKISSFNDRYVFVKFASNVAAVGWCEATAVACDPRTIYIDIPKKPPIAPNIQNDAANNSS